MAHQNQICYLLPVSLRLSLSHSRRWHNYLFILVCGPISPITWAWPHFSRPAHWIAPIMRWQPQVPYGQARSDSGCHSKWQHVRAQLAIVVADGAQICHTAVCQLWASASFSIHNSPGLQEELGILPGSWICARKLMAQIKAECCYGEYETY